VKKTISASKPASKPVDPNVTCTWKYTSTDRDGKTSTELCRAKKACSICGHCSRIDGQRELGHCPGHLGLREHIAVPGNAAWQEAQKHN
jgi:hypothetical protein